MKAHRIYVASSWRNDFQPGVVAFLRSLGHEVYDFKNPAPGNDGFRWKQVGPDRPLWSGDELRQAFKHPIAIEGHSLDFEAMKRSDACVLVLPSGRSASYEFGWCVGAGKLGVVYQPEPCEPELMYLGSPITTTLQELQEALEGGSR